jgi:hypothetical protein
VEKEIGYFKQLGRAEQVLCLILDGVPKTRISVSKRTNDLLV